MIELNLKYIAVAFVNIENFETIPENASILMDLFGSKGYIPSTFYEINDKSKPTLRYQISTPNGEWQIRFSRRRIDIQKMTQDISGSDIGEINDFTREAKELFSVFFNKFELKANRLSLVSSGLTTKYNRDLIADIYSRLIVPIKYYKINQPKEWNLRSIARIPIELSQKGEEFNVITVISRAQVHLTTEIQTQEDVLIADYDKLLIEFDINTVPDNISDRLSSSVLPVFFDNAIEIRQSIIDDIKEVINA